MAPLLDHLLRTAIDWFFHRRSPGITAMKGGFAIVIAAIAFGFVLKIRFATFAGPTEITLDTSQGVAEAITWAVVCLGAVTILAGFLFEKGRQSRKLVLVIEGRGLRDGPGTPLVDAVPARIEGRRQSYLLDLRQKIEDGKIVNPTVILPKVQNLNSAVDQLTSGIDRSDVSLVYGGMTAVPFTFLTGVVLDDEDHVTALDWDRRIGCWKELEEPDNGKRFLISGLDNIGGAREVVLAVSVSYPVMETDLQETFPNLPIVRMTLEDASPNSHWSSVKQSMLADQFLRTAIAIGNAGVRLIHLVLASPNSMVFRLGRVYDKRNLPSIAAYQFEKGMHPPYPWSVLMPVGGVSEPRVIETVDKSVEASS